MIGILILALLQQPTSSTEVVLQFGLRAYQGERLASSATTGQNETVSGAIWADSTSCGVGAGSNAPGGPDRVRWQFSGRIVQRTSTSYTVDIDWQRDGGTFSAAPRTTQQVVLQIGVPQVLDTLTPMSANPCGVTSLRFEAAVVPLSTSTSVGYGGFGVGAAGGRGGGGAGANAGGFGGSAAAGGGGRGRGIGSAAGATGATGTVGGGARGGRGGAGVNGAGASANAVGGTGDWLLSGGNLGTNLSALDFARMVAQGQYAWNYRGSPASGAAGGGAGAARGNAGDVNVIVGGGRGAVVGPTWMFGPSNPPLTPISTGSYDAELWLVHTPPGGKEETARVTVHFGADGDAVAFPLVTVSTPTGSATVDVAVSLRVMADEKGANVLRVIIVRRLDGGASASTGGASVSTGATTKVIPLPAASDTVSFELPQARRFSADALADHPFSVRLKLTSGRDDDVR